jgi:hypothetical protein
LRYSGLEHKANAAIESQVSFSADPAIVAWMLCSQSR